VDARVTMAGVDFLFLAGVVLFLFAIWLCGRAFELMRLPGILGQVLIGILLGPNFFDVVPFASRGDCPFPSFGDTNSSGRQLAGSSSDDCLSIHVWDGKHSQDAWSFAGTLGVTLLIMESGMHINFEKVAMVGSRALVVAIIGTAVPLIACMGLIHAFFPGKLYPDGFAAGCALAPTSVGISINLLDQAKMLNSLAGQTTLTAAFVDDVFSLVLLVLLRSLAGGNARPEIIVAYIFGAFGFLGMGVLLAKYAFPRFLAWLLPKVPENAGASISPRAQVHLGIMLASLVGFSAIGDQIGSHLLGAFVAGMCFTKVPLSHHIWVQQMKRILRWLIRIFFAATVGFAIPVSTMLTVSAFLKGLAIGAVPGILCKLVSGVAARMPYKAGGRELAAKASPMTFGGMVQPLQYLVGTAMIARGEFAFLVAYSARKLVMVDASSSSGSASGSGEVVYMLGEEEYAAVTWGLVWALIAAPFLFKWSLGTYTRSAPVLRSDLIGGGEHSGEDFIVVIQGHHHTGMLHEVLETLHHEGLDIVECHAAVIGGERNALHEDADVFIVRPRGKQKDFDNEKLAELKQSLMEMLGQAGGEIEFNPMGDAHSITDVEERVTLRISQSPNGTRRPVIDSTPGDVEGGSNVKPTPLKLPAMPSPKQTAIGTVLASPSSAAATQPRQV